MLRLLLVGHVAHLVGDCFEPGLVGFDESNHFGESERISFMLSWDEYWDLLLADDGLVD